MLVDFIKLLMFWICRAFFCIFYIFPIKNNRIAFISYKGSQYSCNPKAVSEYILSNYPDKFDIIWGLDNPETYDGIINKNVHVIKHGTMKFYKYLLTSKIVVTNVDYLSYVRFRKGQYIVQTWHGGGSYKKVGNCTKNVSKLVLKRRSYFNLRTDAFISSSATFTNDTILGSFSYKGRIVNSGMPRNDILFTENNKKAKLYERANQMRRQNEFDKASVLYESILNEDTTDAEAYWSLVLCKYGVEYVEDPESGKRIPTCNRTLYASILTDGDYMLSLTHADDSQRALYEEEAEIIDGIQKRILEISNTEEPFDIFICYKETDEEGNRTQDSVLAQDMYQQLSNEGFKVFFARITLEDKLG
ncbi:MAG TPA: CDP-glycerol glycerophosphotransferase family protein, partial [Ruminococcus sp.]|nr:CDP-glycerol glycerophosphotransferase family protein [Ruminococcus sp.]